jgi:hypothetical protein
LAGFQLELMDQRIEAGHTIKITITIRSRRTDREIPERKSEKRL